MGASSERIAIDIETRANVAEVAKARSELSALGETARKIGAEETEAVKQERAARSEFNRVLTETKGNMAAAVQAYDAFRAKQQTTTESTTQWTAAMDRQARAMARAEEAAHRLDSALGMQQRRMAQLHAEALEMDAALGRTDTEGATGSFNRLGPKANAAGIAILFAFESFARGANAAEGPMRAALRSLSMLALALGPEVGIPVAGALALGDALVEMWSRAEKAARKADEQFQKTLETISRGTLAGAAAEQQRLFSGDPFARRGAVEGETDAAFALRRSGLQGLLQLQRQTNAEIAESNLLTRNGTTGTIAQKVAYDELIKRQKEINDLYATQRIRIAEASAVTDTLTKREQERARFELQQLRERAALRDAQRLRPEEVPLGIGNLSAQEAAFGITGGSRQAALGIRGVSSIDLAQQAADRAQRVDTTGFRRIRAAAITETPFHAMQVEMEKNIEALAAHTQQRLGSSLANALAAGITAGFAGGGVKGAFAAAGRTLLAGLGGIFIDLGKTYLEYSGIMEALTPLLGNPFTAGFAGAAIGTALIALGAALEGVGQRGAGGGGAAASGGVFTPNSIAGAGGTTVIIQTVNPYSREVVAATTYYINRNVMLNAPIIPPPGAPS